MEINVKPKVMFFQTIFGMDIVAELDEKNSTDAVWMTINPLQYMLTPSRQDPNKAQEAFGEVTRHAKTTGQIPIQKAHVFMMYEPEERITNNYEKSKENIRLQKSGLIGINPPARGLSL